MPVSSPQQKRQENRCTKDSIKRDEQQTLTSRRNDPEKIHYIQGYVKHRLIKKEKMFPKVLHLTFMAPHQMEEQNPKKEPTHRPLLFRGHGAQK